MSKFGALTEKYFTLEILGFLIGKTSLKLIQNLSLELIFPIKKPKISSVKYFSAKAPNLDVGNDLYKRVLTGFLLKMLHILGKLCTLFFHFEHFSASSSPDPG